MPPRSFPPANPPANPPASDALQVDPPGCPALRAGARADGLELRDDALSLAELDGLLLAWRGDGTDRPWLADELAAYLGTVLVAELPGSRWSADQDSRAVVVQPDGHRIDVYAVVADRLTSPSTDLRGAVRAAHARPLRRRRWWQRGG